MHLETLRECVMDYDMYMFGGGEIRFKMFPHEYLLGLSDQEETSKDRGGRRPFMFCSIESGGPSM